MQLDQINAFRTPDGHYFEKETDARRHMQKQEFLAKGREYAEAIGLAPAGATRAANIIADFLAYEHIKSTAG